MTSWSRAAGTTATCWPRPPTSSPGTTSGSRSRGVIPIEVREPLVKTFHHEGQHLEYALRGIGPDDIARGFVGVVVNSNYARSWTGSDSRRDGGGDAGALCGVPGAREGDGPQGARHCPTAAGGGDGAGQAWTKLTDWAGLSVVERYQSSVGSSKAGSLHEDSTRSSRPFRTRLVASDALVVLFVMLVGLLISSRASTWAIDPVLAIYGAPVVIAVLWLGMLALRGSYDQRVIGLGTEEIRRVVSATLYTFAVVAGLSYLVRADISRAYAFVSLPLGLILIVAVRFIWRGWLYRRRGRGEYQYRTVVVGSGPASDEIDDRLTRDAFAGYAVVARCPAPQRAAESRSARGSTGLDVVLERSNAEAVAVAPSETLTGEAIRQLAWRLEGRDIDLLIAPAMMDIAGPRLSVRPAAGLAAAPPRRGGPESPPALRQAIAGPRRRAHHDRAAESRHARVRDRRSRVVEGPGRSSARCASAGRAAVHHAEVPHHGRGRRPAEGLPASSARPRRSDVQDGARPSHHRRRTLPAPVVAGRAAPAVQRRRAAP